MIDVIKVEYINHSGFVVEAHEHILIFDYVNGHLPRHYLDSDKNVVFFVTHSHNDHYHPGIFSYKKQVIVSDDVRLSHNQEALQVKEFDTLILDDIKIKVFGSTDLGVSYYVELKDARIFHAGDLNHWHWKEESTKDEIDLATFQFLNVIEDIKGHPIDIAMFPVDPRMKKHYDSGARVFIHQIQPTYFFPMHFKEARDIKSFEKWAKHQKSSQVIIPRKDNDVYQCEVIIDDTEF